MSRFKKDVTKHCLVLLIIQENKIMNIYIYIYISMSHAETRIFIVYDQLFSLRKLQLNIYKNTIEYMEGLHVYMQFHNAQSSFTNNKGER